MTKGRSTTYEERIALVRECIQPFAKFTHFCIRTHSVEHCRSFRTFRRGFHTFRTAWDILTSLNFCMGHCY